MVLKKNIVKQNKIKKKISKKISKIMKRLVYNTWFITISPPHRRGRTSTLYNWDKNTLSFIRRCSDNYIIYPEFDDNDRLHYHGIVKIKDFIKWHKQTKYMLQNIGYVKFTKIKDFSNKLKVLFYCKKNYGKIAGKYKRIHPTKKQRNREVKEDTNDKTSKNLLDYFKQK